MSGHRTNIKTTVVKGFDIVYLQVILTTKRAHMGTDVTRKVYSSRTDVQTASVKMALPNACAHGPANLVRLL